MSYKKELQDSASYSKWKPRAWKGVYVGSLTCHSGGLPLIYNPNTTHIISPQFYVLFDEHFTTTTNNSSEDVDTYLEKLFHTSAIWLYKDAYSGNPHLNVNVNVNNLHNL